MSSYSLSNILCRINVTDPALPPSNLTLESVNWIAVSVLVVQIVHEPHFGKHYYVLAVSLVYIEIGMSNSYRQVVKCGFFHKFTTENTKSRLCVPIILVDPVDDVPERQLNRK